MGKVLGDASDPTATLLAGIGDRLGLFKNLAANGPATSAELADRPGFNERYAREWLGGMASAGYLDYDPASGRFALPPEHVPALAEEGGPFFFGGVHQMLMRMTKPLDQLIEVFRNGGSLPQSIYDDNMWDGMERFTVGWFNDLLVQEWIPAMLDVQKNSNAVPTWPTLAVVAGGR